MEIVSTGDVYLCCCGWISQPIGNILFTNLIDIWHGPLAKMVRESILDGSFRYCQSCPYLPGPKGPLVANQIEIDSERVGILKLDYDRSCNLNCPSCRSYPRELVDQERVNQIHRAVLSSGIIESTDLLYITGAGDPFASTLYRKFLRDLPRISSSDKLKVLLHTNGLLFNQVAWERLGETRKRVSKIKISIDATSPETYKLNRVDAWPKLLDNLKFISSVCKSNSIELTLIFVVQSNNFREMPEFVTFSNSYSADYICFAGLLDWNSYPSREEYLNRAIHLKTHPEHKQFLDVLRDSRLKDPKVRTESFELP